MYKTDLTEHEFIKGFFRHPIFLHIYVSREGNVFNGETARFASSDRIGSYAVINNVSRPIHLLVLDTFVHIPKQVGSKPIGNHLNGIKTDNRLVNLEWTDHKGNAEHAFRTGLRSDNTPVLVKDLRTGNIVRHYGIHETGRQHRISGANVHWYLKPNNKGKIFDRYYLIIREGDVWPEIDLTDPNILGKSYARNVYLKDYKNKLRVVFNSIDQAAEHLGLIKRALRNKLNQALANNLCGYECEDFGIWFLDTYLETRELSKNVTHHVPPKQVRNRTKPAKMPIPIIVTDLATGEKETIASSDEFAKRLGVGRKTFQRNIHRTGGVWKGKFHIQYLTDRGPTE